MPTIQMEELEEDSWVLKVLFALLSTVLVMSYVRSYAADPTRDCEAE